MMDVTQVINISDVIEHSTCFRSMGHTNRRHTATLKVSYYVGDHFSEEYKGMNLKNVEQSVEDDYISNLRNNCWKEKQQSM